MFWSKAAFGIWTIYRQGCIDFVQVVLEMKLIIFFISFVALAALVESLYLNDRLPTRVGKSVSIIKR